jgi:hypothetical protein
VSSPGNLERAPLGGRLALGTVDMASAMPSSLAGGPGSGHGRNHFLASLGTNRDRRRRDASSIDTLAGRALGRRFLWAASASGPHSAVRCLFAALSLETMMD